MNEDSGLRFEYGFDSDVSNSYLAVKLDDDAKLLTHQGEIIANNPNPAFVPFHIRRENESTVIYYNITSKVSLYQYLQRKGLNKKELLDLLRGITKNLMLCGNYLLDLSGFVIHMDFIYINPATAEVSLVYIPVHCDRDTLGIFKSFLKELVVNSADVDVESADNYMQRILNYLKSETFSLDDFNRLLMELRSSGNLYSSQAKAVNRNKGADEAESIKSKGNIPSDAGVVGVADPKSYGRRSIAGIILGQVLIILAAAISFLLLMSGGRLDLTSAAGVVIIAGALEMLFIKRTADNRSKKAQEPDCTARSETEKCGISPNTVQKRGKKSSKGSQGTAHVSVDVIKACDTVMISEALSEAHPYLESIGAHKGERIRIDKDRFLIGRLGSMVDYVIQGSTVGKLHAEIMARGGGYLLKDLNSRNGTYINDSRIVSNKEFEIKNNDKIRFSNYEYIFRL